VSYRIRFHPLVERDLDTIAHWIIDHAGVEVAHRKLTEIEQTITDLAHLPHRGSIRDDIVPGLRAIPAARKAVIAFSVDDAAGEILIQAVTYGGADWVGRTRSRTRQGEERA
jgi:plasmid stabilization system protein ParE